MLRRYPLILIAALTAGCAATATTPPPGLEEPPLPAPAATAAASGACAISAILVNSCRPWRGPDIRRVDVAADREFPPLAQDGAHLLINWRPARKWADVPRTRIDQAAAAIGSIAPTKIFLSLHAAPEADVTTVIGCDNERGTVGTPAEYRQMWKLVRERFDQLGVTNVVWVMSFANQPEWDCLVPELYPGDRYVDWIMFGGAGASRFQRLLTGMNGPDRQVLTKPWGVYGAADKTLPNVRAYITVPG